MGYDHGKPALEPEIVAASGNQLSYDNSSRELVYAGVPMTAAVKKAIRDAAAAKFSSGAAIDRFSGALEQLYAENQLVTAAGLEQSIVDSAPGLISYDNARKQLIFAGALMQGLSGRRSGMPLP